MQQRSKFAKLATCGKDSKKTRIPYETQQSLHHPLRYHLAAQGPSANNSSAAPPVVTHSRPHNVTRVFHPTGDCHQGPRRVNTMIHNHLLRPAMHKCIQTFVIPTLPGVLNAPSSALASPEIRVSNPILIGSTLCTKEDVHTAVTRPHMFHDVEAEHWGQGIPCQLHNARKGFIEGWLVSQPEDLTLPRDGHGEPQHGSKDTSDRLSTPQKNRVFNTKCARARRQGPQPILDRVLTPSGQASVHSNRRGVTRLFGTKQVWLGVCVGPGPTNATLCDETVSTGKNIHRMNVCVQKRNTSRVL